MNDTIKPEYLARFEPVHPCRQMPTRHCPATYNNVCGDRPCARFEAQDETPWLPEIEAGRRERENRKREEDAQYDRILGNDSRPTAEEAEAIKARFLAARTADHIIQIAQKLTTTHSRLIGAGLGINSTIRAAASADAAKQRELAAQTINADYDRKPPKITCPMQLAIATSLIGLGIAIGALIWA